VQNGLLAVAVLLGVLALAAGFLIYLASLLDSPDTHAEADD